MKKLVGRKAVVLMYHRIAEPKSNVWDIAVSPAHFEAHLRLLKKLGTVVPLRELAEKARNQQIKGIPIAITFDDGYLDNYAVAKPLLEKYQLPATFFVSTGNIDAQKEFWWDELEELILFSETLPSTADFEFRNERIAIDLTNEKTLTPETFQTHCQWNACLDAPPTQRSKLFFDLWQNLKPLPYPEQQEYLGLIRRWANAPAKVRPDFTSMSIDQVKDLGSSPYFDLGAHTVSHPALAFHSKAFQKQEIQENVQQLQKLTQSKIDLLAYPYGIFNQDTEEVAKELGFKAAFTTEERTVTNQSLPYQMSRYQVANWGKEEFAKKLVQWIY
ncbi:hypothetical protein GCM10011405_00810 [Rufibacter glacialis]|nr:hypothetical protein GCM10011405_00810 [Rufibacter glacialis]